MKYLTAGLAPAKVLEIFEQICAIPHGSGNLDAITDFCEKFARDRHLEVIRDEAHNLIIKKPARYNTGTHRYGLRTGGGLQKRYVDRGA